MLIIKMEIEQGLTGLTLIERDTLHAFVCESSGYGAVITTSEFRNNPIIWDMSDPTLYRYIARLVDKGVLSLAPGRSRGAYVVSSCRIDDRV